MKLLNKALENFSMEIFYKAGIVCFSIIALMGFIMLIQGWAYTSIFQKISSIASVSFQSMLAFLFFWLSQQNKPQAIQTDEEMLKKFNKFEKFVDIGK